VAERLRICVEQLFYSRISPALFFTLSQNLFSHNTIDQEIVTGSRAQANFGTANGQREIVVTQIIRTFLHYAGHIAEVVVNSESFHFECP
jgi:hypothetical protein